MGAKCGKSEAIIENQTLIKDTDTKSVKSSTSSVKSLNSSKSKDKTDEFVRNLINF